MYNPKDSDVAQVMIKVQDLCVRLTDPIYSDDGTTAAIFIGETVKEVRAALKVTSAGVVTGYSQSVIDTASTASVIKITSVKLAAGDCFIIKYVGAR